MPSGNVTCGEVRDLLRATGGRLRLMYANRLWWLFWESDDGQEAQAAMPCPILLPALLSVVRWLEGRAGQ